MSETRSEEMFDKSVLAEVLSAYKQNLKNIHRQENYKRKAVKCFQDNWDEDAADFSSMLNHALEKSGNLLASHNFYPKAMICEMAEKAPEVVRSMFIALFDESRPVIERIENFINGAEEIRLKYGGGSWKSHYQTTNSVTIYLFFRYPSKYYIFKYRKFKDFAVKIGYHDIPNMGKVEGIQSYFNMCNEILEIVRQDNELLNMGNRLLTAEDYPDNELHLLTDDIVFFGSKSSGENIKRKVYDDPIDISQEQWQEMLKNPSIVTPGDLVILRKWLYFRGKATCTEVGKAYKEHPSTYIKPMTAMARRVCEHTKCNFRLRDDDSGKPAWWNIPFTGANTDSNHFQWAMRPELYQALISDGISAIEPQQPSPNEINYWWLNANPKIWSFSDIRVGGEQAYTLLNANGNKRRVYQNFLDAKTGDLVIGYESSPVKRISALCKISRENDGKSLYFEKVEGLSTPIEYSFIKDVPELQNMEYFSSPQGSLFKLTKTEYDLLLDIIREQNPAPSPSDRQYPPYTKQDFLAKVFMSEEEYDSLVSLLEYKKNIILQGAPGVGKTFAAKRLAYSMLGKKDDDKIKIVQFHQNYSYEDFIMGYKPDEAGFKLHMGIFYQFCQQAENAPNDKFFLIIDEINRGNLSKVFGELLMLIEKDYRGEKMTMAYSGLTFSVPENLYIIGMMNTADRSLAMIDYALRRRFSFYDMRPAFHSAGFTAYQHSLNNKSFDDLIEVVKKLNQDIAGDASLGEGFCVGHSYFCEQTECSDERLSEIIEYDLIPMLNEYWFDDKAKARTWANHLRRVLHD